MLLLLSISQNFPTFYAKTQIHIFFRQFEYQFFQYNHAVCMGKYINLFLCYQTYTKSKLKRYYCKQNITQTSNAQKVQNNKIINNKLFEKN